MRMLLSLICGLLLVFCLNQQSHAQGIVYYSSSVPYAVPSSGCGCGNPNCTGQPPVGNQPPGNDGFVPNSYSVRTYSVRSSTPVYYQRQTQYYVPYRSVYSQSYSVPYQSVPAASRPVYYEYRQTRPTGIFGLFGLGMPTTTSIRYGY